MGNSNEDDSKDRSSLDHLDVESAGPGLEHDKVLDLVHGIDDIPSWYLCILFGFQHYLTMLGGVLAIPLLVAPAMCVGNDIVVTAELFSSILFVSGLVTLLQSSVGCRLPIVQGGTFNFLVPTFAILNFPEFRCPEIVDPVNGVVMNDTSKIYTGSPEHTEVWQIRMREIQGAIIAASVFQVVIGFSGLIGVMMRYIGPLVIAPTICLIGLTLLEASTNNVVKNWWIALLTIVLITLFSQHMRNVNIPCCSCYGKRCGCTPYPLFKLFPVILAIAVVWAVCAILTVSDAIPPNDQHWAYSARTDIKLDVLKNAKWFRFTYPGQWGMPTFSVASVFGMLAGILAGMIESIGDYYAAARMSGASPPPLHAINRGCGTTSYSENIGAMGITRVGSRRVIQVTGIIIMLLGLSGKFSAFFVAIPDPIVGGMFLVMFGMVFSVGVSNLTFVDLNSSRNLFVFGLSVFIGLAVPQYVHKRGNFINSGSEIVDQILLVLMETGMLVGGVTGFILDNTIPGTKKERGLLEWKQQEDKSEHEKEGHETYDIPYITKYLKKWSWISYIPISPTYTGFHCGKKRHGNDCETCD